MAYIVSDPSDRPLTYRDRLAFAGILLLIFGLCASIASCTSAYAGAKLHTPDIVDFEYARTVQITNVCLDGTYGGSGVRVGGHAVLTAKHVVECDLLPGMVTVTDQDGKVYPAIVKVSLDEDVARLEVPGLPVMSPVAVAQPVLGRRLCATFALPHHGRRCGEVWPSNEPAPGDIHIDFVAEHGNSGSGVWDEQGRLVGILVYLHFCPGTSVPQVCTAGATSLWDRRWIVTGTVAPSRISTMED